MSIGIGLGLNGQLGDSISENWASNGGSSAQSGFTDSWGNSISEWADASGSSSWYKVFGTEASAKDIKRTAEANAQAAEFWRMQAEHNSKEAQINRDFQEYMSNTSYQRAVMDLIQAGLNPILAAGNMGASTPVGAMGSSGLASAHKAQTFADVQGGSESWSYGGGYSKSSQGSHGENHGSSSWGGSSYGYALSQMSNNVAEVGKAALGVLGGAMTGLTSAEKNNKNYNTVNKVYRSAQKKLHNSALSNYHRSGTYGNGQSHSR